MGKKIVPALLLGLVFAGFLILNPFKQKNSLQSPLSFKQKESAKPQVSETLKEYTDPSGFSLNYPDNLSIVKNDIEDESTYADIQLTAKGVNGSLSLKISDSKFKTIDEWIKLNKDAAVEAPKEAELGNLKGMEIQTIDRLLLGALDNGIFFNIEVPLIEKDFWMTVYKKVLTGFSLTGPGYSSDDVVFEEEVVE